MIDLQEVTLVCIETRFHELSISAIEKTCRQIKFSEVLFFTNEDYSHPKLTHISNLKLIPIQISSIPEYSEFVIKKLNNYIKSSHVLIIQWDGFVSKNFVWNMEFLDFDYLGAPLKQKNGKYINGNGGFSLRSKKLLTTLQNEDVIATEIEDECICFKNRRLLENKYEIKFAPIPIAKQFSYEFSEKPSAVLGFHGLHNFIDELTESEFADFLHHMPKELLLNDYFPLLLQRVLNKGNQAELFSKMKSKIMLESSMFDTIQQQKIVSRLLIQQLIRFGLYRIAKDLLAKRRHQTGFNIKLVKLYVYFWIKQFV